MIVVTGPDDTRLHRILRWAITYKKPLSMTYRKHAHDAEGNALWETREGVRVPLLETTVRTVEPWEVEKLGTSDAYVRGMDRDTNEPRSWRLDRIERITYHRYGHNVVPEYVRRSTTKKA